MEFLIYNHAANSFSTGSRGSSNSLGRRYNDLNIITSREDIDALMLGGSVAGRFRGIHACRTRVGKAS